MLIAVFYLSTPRKVFTPEPLGPCAECGLDTRMKSPLLRRKNACLPSLSSMGGTVTSSTLVRAL